MTARLGWFLALVLVVTAIAWIFQPLALNRPFEYDESDYMYAGTQGFVANYTDRNSMSLWEFVQKGLELRRDPERRGDLSQYVRTAGDLSFYRHYHGPIYAYWIGAMQALGVRSENGYRASGLILLAAGAFTIFWLLATFVPDMPPAGAFAGAVAFAMNRTVLLTALTITQHVVYALLCILALFAVGRFLATGDRRFWYLTAGIAGLAFATVELGVVLIGAIVLNVVFAQWHLGWRHLLGLLPSGLAWFVGVVAVVWPKGVFDLNAVKGYLYIAYIAVSRKTFSPISPIQMWGDKLRNYPLEFIVPTAAFVGMIVYLRCNRQSKELNAAMLPFLLYVGLFAAMTMVVTVPYAHYHGSMMAAASVVVGAAIGQIWARLRQPAGLAALAVVVVTLVLLDRSYAEELRVLRAQPSRTADVLGHVEKSGNGRMLVPYFFVPGLHYYHPEIQTTGYDVDWTMERLALAARDADQVLCNPSVCDQLVALLPGPVESREVVGRPSPAEEPLDALRLR